MPEPAAQRLQNPGGSTASTCSASLADVPPRRLMAPSARSGPRCAVDVPFIGPSAAFWAFFAVDGPILGTSTALKHVSHLHCGYRSILWTTTLKNGVFLRAPCKFLDRYRHFTRFLYLSVPTLKTPAFHQDVGAYSINREFNSFFSRESVRPIPIYLFESIICWKTFHDG